MKMQKKKLFYSKCACYHNLIFRDTTFELWAQTPLSSAHKLSYVISLTYLAFCHLVSRISFIFALLEYMMGDWEAKSMAPLPTMSFQLFWDFTIASFFTQTICQMASLSFSLQQKNHPKNIPNSRGRVGKLQFLNTHSQHSVISD